MECSLNGNSEIKDREKCVEGRGGGGGGDEGRGRGGRERCACSDALMCILVIITAEMGGGGVRKRSIWREGWCGAAALFRNAVETKRAIAV